MKKCRHGIYAFKDKCAECVAEDHSIPTPLSADWRMKLMKLWNGEEGECHEYEEAERLVDKAITAAVEARTEEIKKEVFDTHKQLYSELKNHIPDTYSKDYKHGILRGYTLVARFLTTLQKEEK